VGAAAIGCSSGHCRCSPFTWVFSSFRRLLLYVSSSPSSALSVELSVSFWGEEMPKNKGKGGKNRKRGKNEAEDEKRELVFKEDGQEYAQVLRMLGNGRCEALCIDGTKRLCHIRGKMHKKVWIASGDIILVGLRDYQDDKADVILKYQPDEARLLKAYGELPENVRLNEGIAGGMDEEEDGGGDDYIEFEDEDIDRI
jgi:translation initiation factor 1A